MILVNEEPMDWEPGMTVARIIELRRYTFPMLVVNVNGQLVKRPEFASFQVPDGADVKVIHLTAGG